MKEVLIRIEKNKQEFANLPLFQYLQNNSIHPRQRLVWAPCFTHMAMDFTDLLKYNFRKEPADNKIQELINEHTYEDETHYVWFLEDLEKLGLNQSQKFTDSLKFIWGQEIEKTRQICKEVALLIFKAEPAIVLAVVEAIEATGNVIFTNTKPVAEELQKITKEQYQYFNHHHLSRETGHTMGTNEVESFIESIELTDEQRNQAFQAVDKLFALVTEAMNEMMVYAKNHPIEQAVKVA